MPSAFLDTNILLYAAAGQTDERGKAEVARALIAGGDFGISVQVLQEFFVNAQRPAIGLSAGDTDAWIVDLLEFECVFSDLPLFLRGLSLARRYQISNWDGAILAGAERLGASILYTEDLNHDQLYGAVRVINPFLSSQ